MGYGEIQRDAARYSRYSWIQLDTYEYSWIHIVRYSGIQWTCCRMARYRNAAGYQGYGEIQAGYR